MCLQMEFCHETVEILTVSFMSTLKYHSNRLLIEILQNLSRRHIILSYEAWRKSKRLSAPSSNGIVCDDAEFGHTALQQQQQRGKADRRPRRDRRRGRGERPPPGATKPLLSSVARMTDGRSGRTEASPAAIVHNNT